MVITENRQNSVYYLVPAFWPVNQPGESMWICSLQNFCLPSPQGASPRDEGQGLTLCFWKTSKPSKHCQIVFMGRWQRLFGSELTHFRDNGLTVTATTPFLLQRALLTTGTLLCIPGTCRTSPLTSWSTVLCSNLGGAKPLGKFQSLPCAPYGYDAAFNQNISKYVIWDVAFLWMATIICWISKTNCQ